ncbi:regulatory protein ral2 [Neurospora crassa OR74A]|uniref:Regulatory protein ral2 n=2 Tax=Neurospora crassa (strain ATCC 24698 / 74-OR23-1A / CBS 708.71 / DSM 1257 / FGSC 987) TaxID=367110 RepID=V5ILG5_NEUCR|nr:regulatory protein ral2 [Neurospora crassa OR74A]ESA41929.1 regulatory protein ral2 [Neurospora crassa OR74A]|eukprot:XP_011395220.1 regulatory protein ral2 [Neurospora crassa OR74A]
MAGFGLTSPTSDQQPPSAFDLSRFSDSESEEQTSRSPARTPSEFLSSAFRGIKKITPGREEFARLTRQPSQLGLRRPAESNIPTAERPSISSPIHIKSPNPLQAQHARSLSLQNSLAKPLPEPPPPTLSPTSPSTPTPFTQPPLETIVNAEEDWMDNNRMSPMDSASSMEMGGGGTYMRFQETARQDVSMSSSQSSFASVHRSEGGDGRHENSTQRSNGPMSAGPSPNGGPGRSQVAGGGGPQPMPSPSQHLSGLMCNVHRTTGREPPPLVGATTTVLGDKLFVFGGRVLSRSKPAPLTADLYELDLIRRHWSKIEATGDVPPPRYFHSMCALGDTKLVCYGGMSPISSQNTIPQDQQPEVKVMSDIYIYDAPTRKWTFVQTQEAPQGRYAHCACILPSSAAFASHRAPFSALQHNPSSGNPNEGRIGINIDGTGGAEMVVIGGQDAANHYIEQISVFNLRSLKWVSTEQLGKSCGAYRSVVAPLPPSLAAKIGKPHPVSGRPDPGATSQEAKDAGSSMLIYSNYNFLDVKLELQVRSSDGTLVETTMKEQYSPPGLRFPNGGIIDHYFVVSGTYLTSSKQEYALWALDLRNLSWSRIDAGGAVFSQGSWNRGVLWNRRNTFVVLGHRKRSLVDDYNHRRINFSNVCMVELEAFGFYDNPRKTAPMSGFVSASSPYTGPGLSLARKAGFTAGGRQHSRAAEELGEKALTMRELADMDILCIGGERIPVNSRIIARRWGPYFVQLLREGTACQDGSDVMTLRSNSISASSGMGRSSNMTPTPGNRNTMESQMSVYSGGSSAGKPPSTAATSVAGSIMSPTGVDAAALNSAPTPRTLAPNNRPRCLYLPHTFLTIQALLHFLYTSSLPQPTSPLCTPQILCSLLQIARPYRVDGLLEAVVERLHNLLDSRNAAAVFNATAMAAGGGRGIDGTLNPNFFPPADLDGLASPVGSMPPSANGSEYGGGGSSLAARTAALHINTTGLQQGRRPPDEELSATNSVSGSEWSEIGEHERERGGEIWSGELSSVIGLQKRGLRGLMEGRRMRERTGTNPGMGLGGPGPSSGHGGPGGPSLYGSTPTATSSMQQMQQRVGTGMGGP